MKEQVIVFEGEQMFVAPKKRISNKSKGVSVEVPEVSLIADQTGVQPTEPEEPIRIITTPPSGSGDINVRQPQTFVTQPLPVVPEPNVGNVPQRLPVGDVPTPPTPVDLGNPTRKLPQAGEEITTPITPPPPPAPPAPAEKLVSEKILLAPTTLGSAPIMGGLRGGGGGGGGEEEQAVVPEKKSYLWLWILLAGGAIYFLTKKKK